MSFGKKQKQVKTQYETENQQTGRMANQYVQPAIERMNNLAMNPDDYRKNLINDYYTNSASWSDAQRNMRRQLANATANNYNATNGGYSSAGSKYYDDTTRMLNDYNSRLWDQGVNRANEMWAGDLSATQGNLKNMLGLHDLAQQGDAIDAYNDVADKANKNAWTGLMSTAGKVIGSIPTPVTRGIGAAMTLGGNAFSKDYSDSLNRLGSQINPNSKASYTNPATDFTGSLASIANNYANNSGWDDIVNWYNKKKGATTTPNNNSSSSSEWKELLKRNGWEQYGHG